MAHVFQYADGKFRLLLQALENIPGEQRQIAAQLGMRAATPFFRLVEWPATAANSVALDLYALRSPALPPCCRWAAAHGPQTIELAIYRALNLIARPRGDAGADPDGLLPGLVLPRPASGQDRCYRHPQVRLARSDDRLQQPPERYRADRFHATVTLPPLLAVVVDGLNNNLLSVLGAARAVGHSAFVIALSRRSAQRDVNDDAAVEQRELRAAN